MHHLRLFAFCIVGALLGALSAPVVVPPVSSEGTPSVLVLFGRSDVDVSTSYSSLVGEVQKSFTPSISLWVVLTNNVDGVEDAVAQLALKGVQTVLVAGHSMTDGGILAQDYAKSHSNVKALVLISAFLQRIHRPGVPECLAKASIQPTRSLQYPLGYLADGSHTCTLPNTVAFPTPVLTIGGELDGVVRCTRLAESFYTQTVLADPISAARLPVEIVLGMNHAILLDGTIPTAVQTSDLRAEIDAATARAQVAAAIRDFVAATVMMGDEILPLGTAATATATAIGADIPDLSTRRQATSDFFAPLLQAFVEQEGSWFFTGGDDEHGSSGWAAQAQRLMADPLPAGYAWSQTSNEFHMLSDEESIPPYYRSKHRPDVQVAGPGLLQGSTVTQLRYIELTVTDTAAGLNGYAIIKEEKLNILSFNDTGAQAVAAIELGTKMASRQLVYNRTGADAPTTLDDGNRCATINQAAYDWALSTASDRTVARFKSFGIPLNFLPDAKPVIPAGPWWIWTYLAFDHATGASQANVTCYYAFFSLDADPYGAGNHYGKLLSPARVMEWMYVDGLRDKYHL